MGTVTLSGSLVADSSMSGAGGCAGSASLSPFNLGLSSAPKSFVNATGTLSRNVVSPSAFVELSAVGADRDVPKADIFAIQSPAIIEVRLTFEDDSVVVLPLFGPLVYQTSPNNCIVLVEVKGNAYIQYFACGN